MYLQKSIISKHKNLQVCNRSPLLSCSTFSDIDQIIFSRQKLFFQLNYFIKDRVYFCPASRNKLNVNVNALNVSLDAISTGELESTVFEG